MSFVQRLVTALVPRSWAAAMEAESRAWLARCSTCGHERSIWELGGVRWKATGKPRRMLRCPQRAHTRWHEIHRP
jgi:hypothetical protein